MVSEARIRVPLVYMLVEAGRGGRRPGQEARGHLGLWQCSVLLLELGPGNIGVVTSESLSSCIITSILYFNKSLH